MRIEDLLEYYKKLDQPKSEEGYANLLPPLDKGTEMQFVFEKLKREAEEYMANNQVGFYVSDTETKFISSKRSSLNYDWELSYEEVSGIAFGSTFELDDDEHFIVFIRGNKKPVRFYMPGYPSEESRGLENFLKTIKEKLGFESINWEHDKTIIAYPESFRGKELYKSRMSLFRAYIGAFFKVGGFRHIKIKEELKKELKITK